jgi:asparagine synthetase B (glutamine-hydrolysing)
MTGRAMAKWQGRYHIQSENFDEVQMPGITGLSAWDAVSELAGMERELYPAPGLRRETSRRGEGFACAVHARRGTSGILERNGVVLAFDGDASDPAPRGSALLPWLLDGFLDRGPGVFETLNGSFQAAVHQQGETWLFADPTGSRRLFYTADERGLFFSPEVGPLAGLGRGDRIDRANLVQFLVSGRFFAGQTLLPWVRQLLPGESLRWRGGRLERRRPFHYEAAPGMERAGLLEELGGLLERAILRAWDRSEAPTVLLSGGYDSRYIFQILARKADSPGPLSTVLWGQRMDEPGTDNVAAREVARHTGARHLSLPWQTETLPEQFEGMFLAQSGMTETVFTHSDELAALSSLASRGFRSLLRGDECFGPNGGEVGCAREALGRLSMARAADVPGSGRWLAGGGADWIADHDEALEELLAGAPGDPGDLRDTLYARERLPAMLHHLNYYKLHFVEMVNPFLDADVLRFWSTLPRRCRVDKALLRESYHTHIGDHREVPIATGGNGPDWTAALRRSPALAAWVREGLARLPEPLDRDWFLGRLDAVLHGEPEPPAPPGTLRVPAFKQVARAIVLGRWLRTWAG